jgi:NAD(P)-dependent dehydrogenase (short-subunit alcohol dehydrogenase family)
VERLLRGLTCTSPLPALDSQLSTRNSQLTTCSEPVIICFKKIMAKHIRELFDLTGKTAIVTGGSRGIGVEMAEALAEAGASLMLCARREEWLNETVEEFRGRGFAVEGKPADVASAADVEAVVDETVRKFGRVDVLVNNAGISWGAMPEEMPLDKWQKVLDVNLTGCFLMAQAVGREMLKQNSGSIINIASIAGMTSSANGPFYAGYAASKAGLIGLTRELAASWGRKGIRVNAIAPGFFHSRLADKVIDIYERSIQENNVIPRIGEEGELKGATVFLASDASSYITGQTLVVDGGMTV